MLLFLLLGRSAYCQVEQGLLLHLDFNTDDFVTTDSNQFKTRPFIDRSGNSIRADCQSAWAANGLLFDQCPSVGVGPDGSRAAKFKTMGLCDRASDYVWIEKHPAISALSQGTIAFFEYRENATDLNHEVIDTFGLFAPRTYKLHRDGDSFLTLTVNTNGGRETDLLSFPAGTVAVGRWNHYAIAWSDGQLTAYYNGSFVGNVALTWIPSLDIEHYLAIGAMMHGQPRNAPDGNNCVGQYGQPPGDYVFPNAGFMNGGVDDIRIYNRALTAAEVKSLSDRNQNRANEIVVSVARSGNGFGSVVTVDGAGTIVPGIGCGKHCAEAFSAAVPSTQKLYLRATAYEGSDFSGWTGDCTGNGLCEVSRSVDFRVTAVFNKSSAQVAHFQAENGSLSGPFEVVEGALFQRVSTGSQITNAGRAAYTFNIPEAGDYYIAAVVNVPSQSANSFYVTIGSGDAEPTSENVWHISTTAGFDERLVSWGGATSGNNPPKLFSLQPGTHTLVVRAREPNTAIDAFSILRKGGALRPGAPTNVMVSME